jgi:hypothetical protein
MPSLATAAFGGDPARWPLPAAATPECGWLRAVAAAGQGRYGCAHAELDALCSTARPPLASLAHSTRGSLLRQLGWHRLARGWDGRALTLAGDDRCARVDALLGLSADALGLGRFAVSERLLDAAGEALGAQPEPPVRLAIRLEWVGAELGMASGAGDAVAHARRAVDLAEAWSSVRHRVKSGVVLAAALCSTGRVAESRTLADALLDTTARHGLVPLRWAVASLLDGIGSNSLDATEVREIRDDAATLVERRGGHWHRG